MAGWGSMSKQRKKLPDTATAAEYLASTLALFMAERRLNGQRWTKIRVADFITASPDIRGTISDTTVGRFLDPSPSQAPSPETLSLVAEFLVLMHATSWAQLEALPQEPAIELASAVQRFYRRSGASEAQITRFHKDVRGHYVSAETRSGFYLRTHLVLSYRAAAGVLFADELSWLCRVADPAAFGSAISHFDPTDIMVADDALRAAGALDLGVYAATGAAVITETIGMVMLRTNGRGLSGVHTLNEVTFDANDRVLGMDTDRNAGWQSGAEGEFTLPPVLNKDTEPRTAARLLSEANSFHRMRAGRIRTAVLDKIRIRKLKREQFLDFLSTNIGTRTYDHTMPRSTKKDKNKKLLNAFDLRDLAMFKEALAEGADPNLIPRGDDRPMIFSLAADGDLQWVQAVLASGRCDLTKTDSDGFRASITPGATARRLAKEPTAKDLANRFAEVALLLRAEEIRQLTATSEPPPEPSK